MNQNPLVPTSEDFQALLQQNPMAAEQLKSIILARLLAETEASLASLTNDESEDNIVQINESAGD